MLIALHGFTETDLVWRDLLAPAFPELRCLLLPGHGCMPGPAGADFMAAVAELAARLPAAGQVDLLGYSMGGRLALALALAAPQRVRRLVLVSSSAGTASVEERAARIRHDERLAQILEEDGIGPFVAWWQGQPVLRPAAPLPPALVAELRCLRLNQDPHGLAAALRRLGAGAMPDLAPLLPTLTMPTLLVAGEADARYREVMADMATRIPGARLAVIAGSGHAIHRERPGDLRALVKGFLAG
jgi:2-succinyl-6-hydroxy-2,4-cyclohexadiene-1-carboxylate synthase